ncbi:MAG: DegT/DnrJ/EryC1/StrS family aminotransferase [archaeon]
MRIPLVDLKAQYKTISEEIDSAIRNVIDNTSFIGGGIVTDFEESFAKFCGAGYAVGTNSGTSALFTALKLKGIGKGDEVITVPNTFIATAEAITMTGASVRFVDIDKDTYNMDVEQARIAVNEKTKAILPVHLYGQPADMKPILEIAEEKGLAVIEDACQAHGAAYKGKTVPVGDAACFSFYPGKNLGAYGDAGAIVTNDPELAARAAMVVDHGREKGEKYTHAIEGNNSRLATIQAAVLGVKLPHLARWTEMRRNNAAAYNRMLADVVTPVEAPYARHVYHLYVIRSQNRDALKQGLGEAGIAAGVHYPVPLHLQPAYRHMGLAEGSFPVTERSAKEILSLPMYPELSREQISFVCEKIAESS